MSILASLLRHILSATGGAGMLSDDQLTQVAGALITLGAVAWSIIDRRLAQRSTSTSAPPTPPIPPSHA